MGVVLVLVAVPSLVVVGVQPNHQSGREIEAVQGTQNTIDAPKGGVARLVSAQLRFHSVDRQLV
jgi:hypothetical protein